MSSGSKGKSDALGAIEIVAGILLDVYGGGSGNSLIALGAATILENLLTPNPQTQGMQSVIRSPVATQGIAYGQVVTGGVLMFSSSYGSNGSATNAFLTCCVNHSITRTNSAGTGGMPIGGIEGFYLNDVYVPINQNNGQGGWNIGRGVSTGTTTCAINSGTISGQPAPYNPLATNLWMSWSDGSQTTVDPIFSNFTSTPADFIGYGCAYSTFVMFQSAAADTFSAAYPNGIQTPSTIKALINGQRLYDPRLDSTNGGTGTQRLNDTTTWTFASNPALVLADLLTRSKTDGGAGYANSQINWAAVAAAANVCDNNITVPALGATWSGTAWSSTNSIAQYTFNGLLDTAASVDTNVQEVLKSMAGWLTISNNQIYMFAGSPTASSGTLDETFLAGEVALQNQIPRNQTYNAVKMTYGAEPDADYNAGMGQPIVNPAYETQDGNVRLWYQDTIRGCNNQFACQILEIIKSRQSRNKMHLTLRCNLKAIQFKGGDVIDVNLPAIGLTNSPFRIINYSMSSDYTITMSCVQENANTYEIPQPPDATFQPFNTSTYQTLYNLTPPAPPAPTGVTASAMSSGNLIEYTPPPANLYKNIIVYRSTNSISGYLPIATVTGDSFLDSNTVAGTQYYYYLIAAQPFNGTNFEYSFTGTINGAMASAISVQAENGADVTSQHTSALTTSLSNHVVSDNMVENGNFTNGMVGWSVPSGWRVSSYNTGAGITGTGLFINTITTEQQLIGTVQCPIDQNKTYLLEMWLYCSAAGAVNYAGFAEYDQNGNFIQHDSTGATYGYALIPGGSINGYQYFSAEISGNGGISPSFTQFNQATASIVPVVLFNYGNNSIGEVGIQLARISEVAAGARRGLQATTPGVGNYRAYADFTDNTPNGHKGKNTANIAESTGLMYAAEHGADITGNHTAADTLKVNGVVSTSISPIANLMPEEPGANVTETRTSLQTSNLNNHNQDDLTDSATHIRWKATQQTALITNATPNHVNDPTFTSVADFWNNVGTASAGVFTLPAMASGTTWVNAANMDGRGTQARIPVKPGDMIVMQITCVTAATGVVQTSLVGDFFTAAGGDLTTYPSVIAGATGATTIGTAVAAPANAAYMVVWIQGYNPSTGGNNASVSNPVIRINHETVVDVNAQKAYINANDQTAGGHVNLAKYASLGGLSDAIQPSTSPAFDGVAVTFTTPFTGNTAPEILWLDGGISYDSGITGSQYPLFSETPTGSAGNWTGFTPSLKISGLSAAVTNENISFSTDSATITVPAGQTVVSNAFTVSGTVKNNLSEQNFITITVTDTTHSLSWQKSVTVPANGTKAFSVGFTDTSAVNGTVFSVGYSSGGQDSGNPTIQYQVQGTVVVHTATPTGSPGINWIAFATS